MNSAVSGFHLLLSLDLALVMPTPASNALAKPSRFAQLLPFSGLHLPIELVLRILELLASETRDSNQAYAHSLLLISRTARTSILPILYEELRIQFGFYDSNSEGWDGRTYQHPALAFLSWLLCNPSAPPRKHVSCITFQYRRAFGASELAGSAYGREARSSNDGRPPPHWIVKDLIIPDISHGHELLKAGLHARTMHYLRESTAVDTRHIAALFHGAQQVIKGTFTRNYCRIYTQNSRSKNSWMDLVAALVYQEFKPANSKIGGHAVPPDQRGAVVFFDLGLQEGFGSLSPSIMKEIGQVLTADWNHQYPVVLVLPSNATEKELQDTVCVLRQSDTLSAFYDQLSVARSSWPNRVLMREGPQIAFARVLLQGINPWDTGCRLSDWPHDLVGP